MKVATVRSADHVIAGNEVVGFEQLNTDPLLRFTVELVEQSGPLVTIWFSDGRSVTLDKDTLVVVAV